MTNLLGTTNSPYLLSQRGNSAKIYVEKTLSKLAKNIYVLDGNYMRNWNEFSKYISGSLNFPEYYGQNWDAYGDLMCDLSWLKLTDLVIVISNANKLFYDSEIDRNIFQETVNDFGDYWSSPATSGGWESDVPMPFHVILFSTKPLPGYNAPVFKENM
ncbi:MAG: barstar family protein [Hyphomicrobiales bacterium]|nr:barstar family protein [Hyphomicrobiales bacterium]